MDFAPYQSESPEASRSFSRPLSPPIRASAYSPLPVSSQLPPPILPPGGGYRPSGWGAGDRETINQFETSLPIRASIHQRPNRFHAWQSSLLFAFLVETLLSPLRAAGSRPAQRAYLTTILFFTSTTFLLVVAVSSYILFYINYIPRISLTHPVYLEHSPAHPPTAILILPQSSTIPHQHYTITLHLHLPTSPPNIAIGNFMVDLTLLSPRGTTLSNSRRSAILTYRTPLLTTFDTLIRAPLYLTGLQSQSETLKIPLVDATYDKEIGGVKLVLESEELRVYMAEIEFKARFTGLRWLMYNHRVFTFLVATAVFWGVECAVMAVVWWGIYSYFTSSTSEVVEDRRGRVNGNGDRDDEDEDEDEDERRRAREAYPTPGPEDGASEVHADDEESEEDALWGIPADSGLGSMSESASSARARIAGESGQRRRRSRNAD